MSELSVKEGERRVGKKPHIQNNSGLKGERRNHFQSYVSVKKQNLSFL